MDLYILFRVARIESRYIKRDYKSLFTSGGNYIMQRIKVRRWIAWMLVFAMAFLGQLIPAQAKTILSKPKISRVVSKNAGELKITYKKMPKRTKYQIQVSTDKKFKKVTQSKVVKGNGTTTTFKKLKAVTYYVRMRCFRTKKKKKRYSTWSALKKIRVSGAKKSNKSTRTTSITASDTTRPTTSPRRSDEDLFREFWNELIKQDQNSSTGNSTSGNNNSGGNSSGNDASNSTNEPNNSGSTGSDISDSGNTGNSDNTDKLPVDISNGTIYVYKTSYIYNGEPYCPETSVVSADGYLLKQNIDFTVSYENNINAGFATVHVYGMGNYTGELTDTFEIDKAMPQMASYGQKEAIVGQPVDIRFDAKPEGKCTYEVYKDGSDEQTDQYTKLNENGELVPIRSGIVEVKVRIAESENYRATEYSLGTLTICDEDSPEGGFNVITYAVGDTYKSTIDATTVENGIGTFNVSFASDASDAWLDRHMRFEVEDATPTAYSKAFRWLGQNMTAPTLMVSNTTEELRARYDYGRDNIVSPCAQQPISDTEKKRLSARKLTVKAGVGVRVCKIKAYRDDTLYDVIYIATQPYDDKENYLDEEYYAHARHKVEAKIWTDDMTNLQKLNALASYISTTTHYPGSGCTKKATNPTFWNAFSVDGIDLYYNMYRTMSTLNRIMDLQGGITTCVGVDIVQKAATDDMGLPYLYDSTTGTIADGEGVWLGIKSYSSNPSAAYHVSVIYKDANEKRSFVDAQGMITNTTCEEHGCLDKVIRD